MLSNFISAFRRNISDKYQPSGDGRYERKFVVDRLNYWQIESIIRHHPVAFKEIFKKRQINNIYLDTVDFKTYFDNVYGNTTRIKVRIRWYGDTFGPVDKPVLELKIKNGLAGRKLSFPLNPFVLDKTFDQETLKRALNHEELPVWVKEKLSGYYPALLNCYLRKYFASPGRKVRITIDEKMTYYGISARSNSFIQKYEEKRAVILEMKYDLEMAYVASDISQRFPMRMTKSSKYVNGIDLFYPHLAT